MNRYVAVIIKTICAFFGISERNLLSHRRPVRIALARHCAYWLARRLTGLSITGIGRQFGRDHTTIMHGVARINDLMFRRRDVRQMVDHLTAILDGRE